MAQVTLGGDRLGAGNKQKVNLHNYERSTHDLGYVWRSTMASGTLVPFMSEVGLPGDTFEINLEADIKTHPTIGPLFGSYKVQLDVFTCPIRLYNGKLHMNMLNIGLKMQDIKLPQIVLEANGTVDSFDDNSQINASSIFSYLNIRGLGYGDDTVVREFNAVPYLAYWDIYKNYYANKQEEIGVVIHNPMTTATNEIDTFVLYGEGNSLHIDGNPSATPQLLTLGLAGTAIIVFLSENEPNPEDIIVRAGDGIYPPNSLTDIFSSFEWNPLTLTLKASAPYPEWQVELGYKYYQYNGGTIDPLLTKPKLSTFPLTNIDDMREAILVDTANPAAFTINSESIAPYGLSLYYDEELELYSKLSTQEGLGIKTYQSDLFNNWISTEWIDGDNGINAITAIDTSSGEFTIDTLQLSRKVYDMLNRIAVSGGTYDDWLNAVYTHERTRSIENPVYVGGLSKELAFQEVVSTAASSAENTQPLGTLAGRGVLTNKHKGGKVYVRVDEPSYIMGIISITPRVDYSQGNKWDTNLKTLDDLHKPGLDEIGFQDLITDQMAWFSTECHHGDVNFKSAGKQPAWINYMTNVNQVRGNFAVKEGVGTDGGQMYMTLNRRYERTAEGIKDLTTYIDPSKFNHIFADTRLDAQNFWAQIAVDIKARRKMSARLMPNL